VEKTTQKRESMMRKGRWIRDGRREEFFPIPQAVSLLGGERIFFFFF
jgi:hypothetical protein